MEKIWYSINPTEVPSKTLRTNLYVVKINQYNYHKWTPKIKYLIELFKSEHDWDKMWNVETSEIRFQMGMDLYILLDVTEPIGYVWYDGEYLHNVFVSKKRKDGVSQDFITHTLSDRIENEIILFTDDWNIRAQKLFTKIGFIKTENLYFPC